jgi:hypothetical protein
MPISQISLPVTFLTRENFRTENIQFEVVDFETMYNAFLGRPTLTKFMVIPHYAYLVLKMLGPHGVISIRGYVQRAYDYDKESLAEYVLPPRPDHSRLQGFQNVCPAGGCTRQAGTIVYGGIFRGCSHRQHIGSQIGTRARQIPLGKLGHLCMEAC